MKHDVLIVDDDSAIRESIREVLEVEGYAAHEAENGRVALDLIAAGLKPNVILLDLMMPIMDGLTFRSCQMANQKWAEFPVIIFSANSDVQGKLSVADKNLPVIRKPPDIDVVIAMVKRHLKG